MKKPINKLNSVIKNAKKVAILTGAGISAESGIPTFRGNEGYWKHFSPEKLASLDGFNENPDIVWEWYLERRKNVLNSKPNKAHNALAEMENLFESFALITQNIDGLHKRAGSKNILELHGSLFRSKCIKCGKIWDDFETEFKNDYHFCRFCNSKKSVLPDIVWFGESLPFDILSSAQRYSENCDLFLVIGTSALVYPAAELPVIAARKKAFVLEFNLSSTPLSYFFDMLIEGKAGETLPSFLNQIKSIKQA